MNEIKATDLTITSIDRFFYIESKNLPEDFFVPRQTESVILFMDGAIEFHFEDMNLVAKAGDLFLLPGSLFFYGKQLSENVAFYVFDFYVSSPEDFLKFGAPGVIPITNHGHYGTILKDTLSGWLNHAPGISMKLKYLLYFMFHSIISKENLYSAPKNRHTSTKEILSYITNNIGNPELSLKHLCSVFFVSESQIRRNIQKETGKNPNEYILSLRMKKAKTELAYTHKSIRQISVECGFASPYYFSKCVSKSTGLSPKEYRKANAK